MSNKHNNAPAVPQGEPWYGHKFKEVTRGVWHCECGKTINEGATPCTNGTQSISTMRRDAVNLDATKMHDAGSAAHAGQGQFTRVDGSRSSLRGSGTQDDPFVADNLDDLAAAPTSPSQEPVPGQQPDTFRERNAQFREQNWQIRFDAAVEARRQAQEQLYSERERHNSEIQALRQEISRLLSSQQPVTLTDEPWYGHKFKEVTRGVWHCECGETVNEGATPCTNGTQSISTMRRDAVNVDATEMHDAGSAAHAGQGKFTRVDGSRSSLRGSGTQDDPFVADNLDDLAAAPTSPLQEPVTDDVPAHVEGLLEHRRELDAIEFFESTNRDSHGFRRSVRGTYVNPAVARDWKWFQLGMQHATKE